MQRRHVTPNKPAVQGNRLDNVGKRDLRCAIKGRRQKKGGQDSRPCDVGRTRPGQSQFSPGCIACAILMMARMLAGPGVNSSYRKPIQRSFLTASV